METLQALIQQSLGVGVGMAIGSLLGLGIRKSRGNVGLDRRLCGYHIRGDRLCLYGRHDVDYLDWRITMIITTTNSIEGREISDYRGIVVGEAIMGANVVRDVFASITDIVGGRSGAYESKLQDARDTALRELEERAAAKGAHAVVGVDLDYEVVGQSMLMVSASGTAVTLK